MGKFLRVIVLTVGLLALLGSFVASAGASSWTNSGDTSYTATTGPSTLTANSVSLVCSGGTMIGTAPASSPGPTFDAIGTTDESPCRLGLVSVTKRCSFTFRGRTIASYVPLIVTGTWEVHCTLPGTTCRIDGTLAVTYTNPIIPPGPGRITIPASTNLRVSGSGCALGSGIASLTAEIWTFIKGLPHNVPGWLLSNP